MRFFNWVYHTFYSILEIRVLELLAPCIPAVRHPPSTSSQFTWKRWALFHSLPWKLDSVRFGLFFFLTVAENYCGILIMLSLNLASCRTRSVCASSWGSPVSSTPILNYSWPPFPISFWQNLNATDCQRSYRQNGPSWAELCVLRVRISPGFV